MNKNSNRKRTYIDSQVQGALIRRVIAHWLAFFAVAGMATVMAKSLFEPSDATLFEQLWLETKDLWLVSIISLALFPVFVLDTVKFSHRFVGPITRLRNQLRELGELGTTSMVSFREGDFWTDIADEFNAVTDRIHRQRQEIQDLKMQLQDRRETSVV
jgi:hypothetical protein